MTQDELLLATKNRAITRCWLNHTSNGQIAAATAGLLWPIGTVVAGMWGVVAMGGFAGVILIGSVWSASREADAIDLEVSEGKFIKMAEYLTQDDLLDLKRRAKPKEEEPEKKLSPDQGQTPEPEPKPEPDTDIELPVAWQRVDEPPDMVQVWPRSQAGDAGDHPITQPGSADWVMREPQQGDEQGDDANPAGIIDPVALMAQTPFETVGPYRTDEVQLFRLLKDQKRTQADMIKILYHCVKGGTEAYRRARDRYLRLLKLYCDLKQAS